MFNIVDRYEIQHADELKALDLAEKLQNYLPHKELLELVQSNLEEPNVALSITSARKTELMMELVKSLQEKEKLLIEENQVLASQMERNTSMVTDDERAMSPEYKSGNNPPETLSLLK